MSGTGPASLRELRALQLDRLRHTFRHVYEDVPSYRRKFGEAGVGPGVASLSSLDGLAKFPLTTKDYLREAYPFGLLAVPRDQLRRVHASSGTTGTPTVVGYTARDLDVWAEVMARSIAAAGGGRPG
jgi:phenylacetate-CoA ligase